MNYHAKPFFSVYKHSMFKLLLCVSKYYHFEHCFKILQHCIVKCNYKKVNVLFSFINLGTWLKKIECSNVWYNVMHADASDLDYDHTTSSISWRRCMEASTAIRSAVLLVICGQSCCPSLISLVLSQKLIANEYVDLFRSLQLLCHGQCSKSTWFAKLIVGSKMSSFANIILINTWASAATAIDQIL